MNERITCIATFNKNNLSKIEKYTKLLSQELCKVPFGKNVDNRKDIDTLPYHFTLSAWDIKYEEKIIKELSQINYPELKVIINDVQIMNGKENSYVLYFNITKNETLELLQRNIYQRLPNKKYKPETFNFHITIHIDQNYNNIKEMQKKLLQQFHPFELEIESYNLYEIYPAKIVKTFKNNADINDK